MGFDSDSDLARKTWQTIVNIKLKKLLGANDVTVIHFIISYGLFQAIYKNWNNSIM